VSEAKGCNPPPKFKEFCVSTQVGSKYLWGFMGSARIFASFFLKKKMESSVTFLY